MPSSAVMPARFSIDANTLPLAFTALNSKMALLCPGMPFEVRAVTCDPAPGGTPPRLIGPPWRFTFECVFTLTIP